MLLTRDCYPFRHSTTPVSPHSPRWGMDVCFLPLRRPDRNFLHSEILSLLLLGPKGHDGFYHHHRCIFGQLRCPGCLYTSRSRGYVTARHDPPLINPPLFPHGPRHGAPSQHSRRHRRASRRPHQPLTRQTQDTRHTKDPCQSCPHLSWLCLQQAPQTAYATLGPSRPSSRPSNSPRTHPEVPRLFPLRDQMS